MDFILFSTISCQKKKKMGGHGREISLCNTK